MSTLFVGSARIGENGSITGGKDGDQKQTTSKNDRTGEVSSQPFYVHSKGWVVLRPKSVEHANAIAKENKAACDNKNIGYNQNERYDIVNQAKKVKSLADISVKCNSDCSSTVRAEIITACGVDAGDFNTLSEVSTLYKTGLFEKPFDFVSLEKTPLYDGDVLTTKTKGHTVTVNSGNPRKENIIKTPVKPDKVDNKIAGDYKTTAKVRIRESAGKDGKVYAILNNGKKVTATGGYTVFNNVKWFVCTATVDGVKYKGYVKSKYLARV